MPSWLKILFKRSVWAIISLFFVVLLVIAIIAETAVKPYERWIDQYLGVRRTFLEEDELEEGEEPVDTNYYPANYAKYNDDNVTPEDLESFYKMQGNGYAVSQQVNEEGMVLLWNKNDALPLDPETETNVSTFGIMGISHKDGDGNWADNWAYHATGSANVDLRKQTDATHDGVSILKIEGHPELDVGPRFDKSLKKFGFEVNQSVIESTWENGDKTQMNGYEAPKKTKDEVEWSVLQGDTKNNPINTTITTYNDVVFYTIGRWTGEGQTEEKGNRAGKGAYLTDKEKSVLNGLSELRASNSIKKLVVLMAYANPIDINDFKNYNIDAALWVGNGGNTATDSIVNVLVGNVSPSGKLVDTWAYDNNSAPAAVNYGYMEYDDPNKLIVSEYNENVNAYLVYQEGIYVGYRYYETRYEDSVMNKGGAKSSKGVVAGSGNWDYNAEVAYPFGYGTSYTTFEYSGFHVEKDGSNYEISVTVTNTGKYAGKETVQIYLQKPYTEFDQTNKIEKAAVELVGYAKTNTLAPNGKDGNSQTLTITVPEYEFKTYDANVNKTYIIEKGDYYLTAAANAHDAVNNILAKKGYGTSDGMDAEGNEKFAYMTKYSSTKKYENPYGSEVTNQFDDIDINKYDGTNNKVTYLSRNDWNGTYPDAATVLKATAKIAEELSYDAKVINNPEDEMPKMGDGKAESYTLKLIQLKGVDYDDPLWDDLLDTLTYDDMLKLIKHSMVELEGIAANAGAVYDGPIGMRDAYIGELGARCAYPCAPILAATYNDELIAKMTDNFADQSLVYGRSGLWGVSSNIHRTHFNGRNNEYYSEDGYLAGHVCAVQVKALTSRGILTYVKHLALNNYEAARVGVNTWANEQSVREIYLKAFEESATEGGGNGFMTSYNRIGTKWTGAHAGLLTNVLRDEWSFKGVTCTDYADKSFKFMGNPSYPNLIANAVIAGQDEWIADVVTGADFNNAAYKNNATFVLALRESAHRNLYTRIETAAMNGVGSNTRVVVKIPAWQQAITNLKIAAGVFTGAALAVLVTSWVLWYLGKRNG